MDGSTVWIRVTRSTVTNVQGVYSGVPWEGAHRSVVCVTRKTTVLTGRTRCIVDPALAMKREGASCVLTMSLVFPFIGFVMGRVIAWIILMKEIALCWVVS
uniref:Uncharacterized protein n=1 Tax=Cacopsylla melanoneura TaxID=428564 RepID=A0A8D8ZQ42_9HEMI